MKKLLLFVVCSLLWDMSLLNAQRLIPGQQGLEASFNLLPTSLKLDTKAYEVRLGYIHYRGKSFDYIILHNLWNLKILTFGYQTAQE